jgi:uncharacterized protein (PEP-CTERM system associated)
MRRELAGPLWACAFACAGTSPASAQSASRTITPSIEFQAQATTNALASFGTQGKKDLVTTITPGLGFRIQEGGLETNGQWRVSSVRYVRKSQPDRLLPSGQSLLKLSLPQSRAGIEAMASAEQVQATFLGRQGLTPSTADTYTNVSLGISPFFAQPLTPSMRVEGRLRRTQAATIGEGEGLAVRPMSMVTDDQLQLLQKPQPWGWGVVVAHQATDIQRQAQPSLDERSVRLRSEHLLGPDFQWGLSLGRVRSQVDAITTHDNPVGLHWNWTPTVRTALRGEIERRYFGNNWALDAGHRLPWLAFKLHADRSVVTYATSVGAIPPGSSLRDLYSAMLTTRIPDEMERGRLVDELVASRGLRTSSDASGDVYDQLARIQQRTTGSVAYMGRRTIVTLSGGLSRTQPLLWDLNSQLLSDGQRTKEYHFDAQLNHQLTPNHAATLGLRWAQASTLRTPPFESAASRDFTWRLEFVTRASPRTNLTLSARKQIRHLNTSDTDEATAGLALLHRF